MNVSFSFNDIDITMVCLYVKNDNTTKNNLDLLNNLT